MLSESKAKDLKRLAIDIRKKTLYQIAKLGLGHVGGSMSVCELMACMYGEILNVDPNNPAMPDRDRFILSKGHAGPAMYSVLAIKGFFPLEELDTLNKPGTNLPSHTDCNKTKGVDMTTGSLGQGISSAAGIALACKMDKRDNYTYCVLGDGECQEGQVWEAAMFAAHYNLTRFILFVDKNVYQLDGPTDKCMSLGRLDEKFEKFGFYVQEVDGHDVTTICDAVLNAKTQQEKPSAIILNTVKGKDCPVTSRVANFHMMPFSMADYEEACELYDRQLAELG